MNILALKLYYDETGSQNALNLANSKTQQQVNLGNPLMFERINDVSGEFLPVTAISAYTGLRYVWRSSYNKAILARGGDYYTFTVYSDQVERSLDGARTDTMTGAARFQTVVHIPDDYSQDTFGVEAIYVPGGDYGVASSDTLMGYARTLFEAFLEEAASRAG
ncbi:hypothetical protein SDC9_195024 [bioreactor metagenome]|uniref:Uncharacterized protein n=1 Tax=bioreactor metagenome TaxID=1076179 RepID=A0A645I9D9_9ZZZZ